MSATTASSHCRVLIIQEQMKRYRVPFFVKLHDVLSQSGISLRVAYSEPPIEETAKADSAELPSTFGLKVKRYDAIRGRRLLYQPLLREMLNSDLVITEHAAKHLNNFLLLALSKTGRTKVAFSGTEEICRVMQRVFPNCLKNARLDALTGGLPIPRM